MWPTALAIVIAIPLLGRSDGPYPIGSITFFANVFGPWVVLAAIAFAGARWCSIGHLRPRGRDGCGRCGYPTAGRAAGAAAGRCPECGAEPSDQASERDRSTLRETFRGVPIARLLLDLPGLLLLLVPPYVIAMAILILFGVIDD